MRKLSVLMIVAIFLAALSCADMGGGEYALEWVSGVDPESESPISLTASDGTGLRMVSLALNGVVEDPLAFTELHMTFENPENRQREGRFEITLPPGAAISRFAMKIGDRWQEAEVVERQAARVAYEDFLHKKQDPALLEKKAGNQFRARVFPIPANAKKELILSYSQELTDNPYLVPLQGLPEVDVLDVKLLKVEHSPYGSRPRSFAVKENKITPKQDLVLVSKELPNRPKRGFTGLRHGDLALARVAPELALEAEPLDKVTILLDTSASRAMGFERQVERLGALVGALRKSNGGEFGLRVVCFDQEVVPVFEGSSSGFDKKVRDEIVERHALGASDLEGALDWLAGNPDGSTRLVLVTDGIATAGEQGSDGLRKKALGLAKKGIKRIDAVIDGGIRDETLLGVLTNAGLPSVGVVIDAAAPVDRLAGKLTRATMSGIGVNVPGAEWVWPTQLDGVQSGDEFLIYAGLPPDEPMKVLLEGVGEEPFEIELRKAQRPLLERASANAQIQAATHRISELEDEDSKTQFKKQIVDLSIKHRVLSDYTALLVLETEADYERFKIDRNALSDIMVVGKGGIELMKRGGKGLEQQEEVPQWLRREKKDERQGGKGKRHKGEEGQMGKRDARKTDNHYGIKGPRDNPNPHMARATATAAVEDLGVAAGARRGGGSGEGTIGLGNLNTIGHGGGGGSGSGYGRGAGGLAGRRGRAPRIRSGAAMVRGSLSKEVIRRIVHRHINEIKFCYERGLSRRPDISGRVAVKFIISGTGAVQMSAVASSTLGDPQVENCMAQAVRRWTFPQPEGGGVVIVTYPFQLTEPGGNWRPSAIAEPQPEANSQLDSQNENLARGAMHQENPYDGRLKRVMDLLEKGRESEALKGAWIWRADEPGDVLAIIGLGEAAEASARPKLAARAYGSIIDLFPSRADLRRMAGQRLERLGALARGLVVDTYRQAVEQRPDHPSSHRLYGYALLEAGRYEEAFNALKEGLTREYPGGRYAAVKKILGEDLGLIAAAWLAAVPGDAEKIKAAAAELNVAIADQPSVRFVLHWETDANDVDLHLYDGRGDHAYYSKRTLGTGGELYADVTTGYGPECFNIKGPPRGFPYAMQAHYYSRGPMGYGMGKLQIIEHDGKGKLWFENRPFVIMNDNAYVGQGMLKKPLSVIAEQGEEPARNEAEREAAKKLVDIPIAN